MLLFHIRGPKCFRDLRTIDNVEYSSYQKTCDSLNLLDNDEHLYLALNEAAVNVTGNKLRILFATILTHCEPNSPNDLWLENKDNLIEDLKYKYES